MRDFTTRIYIDIDCTYRSGSTTISIGVNEVLLARDKGMQEFYLAGYCMPAGQRSDSHLHIRVLGTEPLLGKDRMIWSRCDPCLDLGVDAATARPVRVAGTRSH